MNTAQREGHWLAMTPKHTYYPTAAPSKVNRCMDKFPSEILTEEEKVVKKKKPVIRRSKEVIEAERIAIVNILDEDMTHRETYDFLIKEGHLVDGSGTTLELKSFYRVIAKVKIAEGKTKVQTVNGSVRELISNHATHDQIKKQLGLNKEQMVNVFHRLRISLREYKKGSLVYL